jgi:MarR family transcriptional regulator, 2-MHQ and catechol-resistance regulon repressor
MPVNFGFDNTMLKTWLLLHQTYDMVLKVEETVFARIGLTPQYNGVLMAINYSKGSVTIKDIANWLDRNSNSVSTLIDRMQRDGLVQKVENTHDRREVRVELTDKGKDMFLKADALGWQIVDDVLKGIPEEDLRLLDKQLENVKNRAFSYLNPDDSIEPVKTVRGAGKKPAGRKHSARSLSE